MELGSLSEIGTLMIAGAALLFAKRANDTGQRMLLLERKREDRSEALQRQREYRDERADQADLVWVWADSQHFGRDDFAGGRSYGISVQNRSALPVFDFAVYVRLGDAAHLATGAPAMLNPGAMTLASVDLPSSVTSEDVAVAFRFRDMAGRVWGRNFAGELTLLTRPG